MRPPRAMGWERRGRGPDQRWHPRGALIAQLALLLLTAVEASAQTGALETKCTAAGGEAAACRAGVDIVEILTARALIAAEGGNPVPGTASTLGRRVPGVPRVGLTARFSAARVELPRAAGGTRTSTIIGWNADVAVGLLDGVPAFATVGGIGSVDLLASVGSVRMPGEGPGSRSPFTWSAGARLGVFRESFTMPGISVSAMYRRLGSTGHAGALSGQGTDGVSLDGTGAWSLRAVVGKRVALFGLSAGLGYTTWSTDATVRVGPASPPIEVSDDSYDGNRTTMFGSATWTTLVFSLTAEVGWQSGSDALEAGRVPASDASGGGLFLSLAGRLII